MKKGLTFFIVFVIISSVVLYIFQRSEITTLENGQKVIRHINKKNNTNLNKFISLYNTGSFESVEVINNKKLVGYKFIGEKKPVKIGILREKVLQKQYNKYVTQKPKDTSIKELGFDITGETEIIVKNPQDGFFQSVFLETILPLLIFVIILIFLLKLLMPKGGSGGLPFGGQGGKQKAITDLKTKFKDIAGAKETKNELEEVVDYLKNSQKYQKVGAKVPRGVLLYGPPGSGKTLIARAVAGEAGVPFFISSGSEFMEMLVGMGASKVRDLFNKAKQAAPAIIFIDEIDAIGKKRGMGSTGGHQEQEQTLNQILSEMDGFDKNTNVIVIAATNRPDSLDKALLRPGRFDRKVYIPNPTLEERIEILKIYTNDKKLDQEVDLESIARRTSGFVGSDLENLVNEAALKIARDEREKITNEDFEYALEKIVMGPEKKINSLKKDEKEIITYHELGHAITAYNLPNVDPVEKISIVSRGMALGVTWMVPTEDRYLYSKAKFLDELVSLLGGRASEEVFFGKENVTTGASNDFERATQIAHKMVTKYGMEEELGTLDYDDSNDGEMKMYKPYSESTAEKIDKKVKEIIDDAYEKSKKILKDNKKLMHSLAELLYDKEYLTKEEFNSIMEDPSKIDEIKKDFEKTKEKKVKDKEDKKEEYNKNEKEEKDDKSKKDNKNKLEDILDRFLK